MDERQRQAILDAVDAGFEAQLALTQRMVKIPSYSKHEAAVQKVVAEALAELGWAVDAWSFRAADIASYKGFAPTAEDYENSAVVVGTLNADAVEGRSLILNGHVDVVPTSDPASWSADPFDARIENGKLYGRGSGDMKAGLVCGIYAVEALRRAGLRPKGRIHVQSVPDEEGSGNGTLACVERGYTADVALVLEPSAEEYFTAQVGILWWHVDMRGTPQHASGFQGRAPNVIEQAFTVIEAMRTVETHANLPENRHPAYKDHPFPIRLNVGMIEGGNWPSSSPADCRFSGRIAIYPDQDPQEVMAALRKAIDDRVEVDEALQAFPPKITFLGNQFSGYEPKGEDAAKALLGAAHQAIHGQAMRETCVAFGSDARVLGQDGGVPSMIYGPISHNLHGLDESVDVESLRRVTKTVALFIADWCGTEAEGRA